MVFKKSNETMNALQKSCMLRQRWELIKENERVRKKERKHALDQESDQDNDQEQKEVFRLKNIINFTLICRLDQILYI